MKNKDVSKRIKKSIQEKVNVALTETLYEIGETIQDMYKDVIREFYRDYTPLWYGRTYSTFVGSSAYKDYSSLVNEIHPGIYEVGIDVSAKYITGNPYKKANKFIKSKNGYVASTEWIFDRTFYEGIHGVSKHDSSNRLTINIPHEMKPSPYELMNERFSKKINQNYIDDVFYKLKDNGYSNITKQQVENYLDSFDGTVDDAVAFVIDYINELELD